RTAGAGCRVSEVGWEVAVFQLSELAALAVNGVPNAFARVRGELDSPRGVEGTRGRNQPVNRGIMAGFVTGRQADHKLHRQAPTARHKVALLRGERGVVAGGHASPPSRVRGGS